VSLPLEYLRCPHCGAGFTAAARSIRCESGHTFDVARQGYVDLMPAGRRVAGDGAEMVAAREAFLGAGHLVAFAGGVAGDGGGGGGAERTAGIEGGGGDRGGGSGRGRAGARAAGGCVVEVGAGTGYYLARARGALVGIALDSSRYAARRAARAGLGVVVCDVWRGLPVRDEVAAAVLCVFAPRNPVEMRRILAPGGVIVVVTPTPRHLAELVEPLGLVRVDERKPERLAASLGEPARVREVEEEMRLSREDVAALVAMGPSAHHVDAERVARAAVATLSVHVAVYR
jgi:23S rRNA (guanine745-N1)-methyltransferase